MGKLTAVKIRSLSKPGRYSDGDGLFLELNRRASGSWLLRIQTSGKRRDIGLGSLSSVSLADAREVAFETRRQIAQGIDPVAEKKKQKLTVPTFREAAKAVHEEYRHAHQGQAQRRWDPSIISDDRSNQIGVRSHTGLEAQRHPLQETDPRQADHSSINLATALGAADRLPRRRGANGGSLLGVRERLRERVG